MALGGGNWLPKNKVLPGSYINFSSVAKAFAALSDRGYAAAPFVLSWGPEGEVFPVTSGEFQKNSKLIRELEKIRAVENFDPDTVTCEQGDKKKAVLLTINGLNIINAMIQLYMSVIIQ